MRRPRDLTVVVVLALVLAGATLALAGGSKPVGPPFRMSGHGPAFGLSGLKAGLQAVGVDVHQGVRPTLGDGLTVLVEPEQFSRDEAAQWRRAIAGGSTVLLATDHPDALTRALGLEFGDGGSVTATASGSTAFPDATFPAATARSFTKSPSGSEPLADGPDGVAMTVVPVGKGAVWAISDPRWLTNASIEDTGLPIVLPLAAGHGGAVTVDEFHHGAGPGGGTLGYLPSGLQLTLLQAGLVVVIALFTVARRLGPVRPVEPERSPSTAELALSLAGMHRSAGRIGAATLPLAAATRGALGSRAVAVERPLAELEAASDEPGAVRAWRRVEEETRRLRGADR